MNSESGKRCSVEELKERNLPHDRHPSVEEWNDLLAILGALYRLTAAQADGITKPRCPVMKELWTQTEVLVKEAAAIRQLLERREQAGRKKERRRLRLPQVTLPRPNLGWLWAVPISLGLLVLWFSGAAVWNNQLRPFLQLIR